MNIDFNSSAGPSLGVEVELELVDAVTGELASAATPILAELGASHPDGTHPKAKHELFECTVEIITGICGSVAEARADLQGTLDEVAAAADRRGLALMCSGTHPFSSWHDQQVSPDPRYAQLLDEMQWMARRLQIFGVHVHVGIKSPQRVVAIANALAGYIPHLLALTASSPFWEGRDTGLASARSKVFEGLPTVGLPAALDSWEEFEQFMGTLVSSGAISTVREVWWDIRPHPDFGTVELRMCDGIPTLSEIAAVAALGQCLVTHLDDQFDRGITLPRHRDWVLRQNKWRAGRHGLDAEIITDESGAQQLIRQAVLDLVDELAPVADRLGCGPELARVEGIVTGGASYARQRAAVPVGAMGAGGLQPVVDLLVAELASDVPGVLPFDPVSTDVGPLAAGHAAIASAVAAVEAQLVALRRDLHAHPEPSWEEHRTTEVVASILTAAGLAVVPAATPTGLLCDVGDGEGVGTPLVVLRADLDALRMPDVKDVPYRSTVPGVCHACGHDLHTAAAVGAALALHRTLGPGRGRVRVVFQPAEEAIPSGARALAEAGTVDGASAVFALHCDPQLPVGQVGLSPGPITSAADLVEIHLRGPGGHTARPHRTADLVQVAARLAVDLPAALDRLTDPRDGVNLTFGVIRAGDAANVIPTEAVLQGSLRATARSGWEQAARLLPSLVASVADVRGASWTLDHRVGAPPVDNDPWATELMGRAAASVLGATRVRPTRQSGGGEDFSWLCEEVPGAFLRLGITPPGAEAVDIHTAAFDVDETAIGLGARLLAGAALEALAAVAGGPAPTVS